MNVERIEATEQAILELDERSRVMWGALRALTVSLVVVVLICAVVIGALHAAEMPDKCAKDWHQFLQDHPDERVIFTGDDENGQPVFKILAQPDGGTWRLIVLAAAEEPKNSCVVTSGPSWIGSLKQE